MIKKSIIFVQVIKFDLFLRSKFIYYALNFDLTNNFRLIIIIFIIIDLYHLFAAIYINI